MPQAGSRRRLWRSTVTACSPLSLRSDRQHACLPHRRMFVFPSRYACDNQKNLFLLSDIVLQQCEMRIFAISVVFTCVLIQIFAPDPGFAAGRKKKVSPAEQ